MNENILISAEGSVTIDVDEYRELVRRSAYLDVILSFARDPKPFVLTDISCMVSDLLMGCTAGEDYEGAQDDESGDADA